MRILFLSTWFPYPPSNGSKQRVFNLLRGLAVRHEVTLLSFADWPQADPGAPALTALCRRIETVTLKPLARHSWRGYLRSAPRWIIDTYSEAMVQRICAALQAQRYDVVIASQLLAASYVHCCGGLPALYEEVELGVLHAQFARAPSLLQRGRYGLTWLKHRYYLARLLQSFRACTVVSEHERQLLARIAPQHPPITVIPNAINLGDYEGVHETPHPNRIIFAGSFGYFANYDAMCWFLRAVYPLIRTRVSDVQLIITGDAANRAVPAPNVTYTGYVEDVRPLVASSWTSVAPIRVGGGTRVKILEAMALGTPVVATSKGAQGLDVRHGVHLLIADTPHAFAENVLHLLADRELRLKLTRNARNLVEARYNWTVVGRQFEELVAALAARRTE
jgi:glycosyltransferase involved in cell wall biosynthesis